MANNNKTIVECERPMVKVKPRSTVREVPLGGEPKEVLTWIDELNGYAWVEPEGGSLKAQLTTNITVGGVPSGTTFDAGTNIEQIIRKILIIDRVLQSISITTPPSKTSYVVGESFNPAGMVVKAHYNYGEDVVISNYTYTPAGALATTDTKITISYSEGGITKTCEQAITVSPVVSTVDIYYGALDFIPTSLLGLTKKTVQSSELIGKYEQHIVAGNVETEEGQYVTFAVPEKYIITDWYAKGFEMDIPHTLVSRAGYNIYYLNVPSYDEPNGITYEIYVREA